MYSFTNDYSECAHSSVLKAIDNLALSQNDGYSQDIHCRTAASLIREQLDCPHADIHFLPGGTITNLTFISHCLKPYEAVISADSGHINTHETGAIESSGHKVISISSTDGKLSPQQLIPVLKAHNDEHCVLPAMVYLSLPTELGTLYSKAELEALYYFCRQNHLLLYIDGARLAMALSSSHCDLTFKDLPLLCDAFYIGGTKCGILFGEALVIVKEELKKNFRYSMKQKGALTAKGWLLGVQFEQLFSHNLYLELGEHANRMCALLLQGFLDAGFLPYVPCCTNQLFIVLEHSMMEKLKGLCAFSEFFAIDNTHSCVRFVTSWATPQDEIEKFTKQLKEICHAH